MTIDGSPADERQLAADIAEVNRLARIGHELLARARELNREAREAQERGERHLEYAHAIRQQVLDRLFVAPRSMP